MAPTYLCRFPGSQLRRPLRLRTLPSALASSSRSRRKRITGNGIRRPVCDDVPERIRRASVVGRVHEAGVFMLKLVQAVLSYFLDTENNQLLMRRHEAYQRQQRWLEY